jgi:hypothetical protein
MIPRGYRLQLLTEALEEPRLLNFHDEDRRDGILVLDETGLVPRWQAHGTGLRNPVGFDWHPRSGVLRASNNGPDGALNFSSDHAANALLRPRRVATAVP